MAGHPAVHPVSKPSPIIRCVSLTFYISYCIMQFHKLPQVLCGVSQPTADPSLGPYQGSQIRSHLCGQKPVWCAGFPTAHASQGVCPGSASAICGGIQPLPDITSMLLTGSKCFRTCAKLSCLLLISPQYFYIKRIYAGDPEKTGNWKCLAVKYKRTET